MFPAFDDVSLDADQTVAATQLLLRVAHVDGARTAEEVALIRQFYDGCRNGAPDWPAFDSLQSGTADSDAAGHFTEPAQRDMVVATCLMVAYADARDRDGHALMTLKLPEQRRRNARICSCKRWR